MHKFQGKCPVTDMAFFIMSDKRKNHLRINEIYSDNIQKEIYSDNIQKQCMFYNMKKFTYLLKFYFCIFNF